MYLYEERIKAVKLLLQYDMSYSTVVRELGYPSKATLRIWYNEYLQEGDLHRNFIKPPKFTEEDKLRAVNYYLEHGKCISRTVKKLGYPSRPVLNKWILEFATIYPKCLVEYRLRNSPMLNIIMLIASIFASKSAAFSSDINKVYVPPAST